MRKRTPQPFLTGRLWWASSGSNSRFSRENGRGNSESCGEGGGVAGAVGANAINRSPARRRGASGNVNRD